MKARLANKVAIVTGAGRGIGRNEALTLAEEGAAIIVADFGQDEHGRPSADLVAAEIREAGGAAIGVSEDIATTNGADRTIAAAIDTYGGLDILVNNAGLRGGNPVHKLTDEQWTAVLDSHLKATFLTIRAAAPHLRTRGGGSIVNTGSEAGLGMPFNPAYAAAKEGIAGLTRSVAREQGRFGIRCNLIRPRATGGKTGGGDFFAQKLGGPWKPLLQALGRYWIGERGAARWDKPASPESIGAFVAWLCSPAAMNVNGQDFFIGGDELALLSPPRFEAAIFRSGGWSVDALDELAPSITAGLVDPFRFANPLETDD